MGPNGGVGVVVYSRVQTWTFLLCFSPEKVLLGCDAAQSCKSIVSEEEISSGIDFGFGGREGGGGGSIFRK